MIPQVLSDKLHERLPGLLIKLRTNRARMKNWHPNRWPRIINLKWCIFKKTINPGIHISSRRRRFGNSPNSLWEKLSPRSYHHAWFRGIVLNSLSLYSRFMRRFISVPGINVKYRQSAIKKKFMAIPRLPTILFRFISSTPTLRPFFTRR